MRQPFFSLVLEMWFGIWVNVSRQNFGTKLWDRVSAGRHNSDATLCIPTVEESFYPE